MNSAAFSAGGAQEASPTRERWVRMRSEDRAPEVRHTFFRRREVGAASLGLHRGFVVVGL